ncbi:hypothetical protein LJB87_00360 [Alistipes sp. OttesenSCG-928-L06]|nr:hypothetical protein [Alistipes sp. OttesenSCG-928-L06]
MASIDPKKIVKRFNDAIEDLANAEIALLKTDNELHLKHLRDAGEAISQATEWALTYHISTYKAIKETKPNIQNLVDYYKKDKTLLRTHENYVNFQFFVDNKARLTNLSKHQGDDPNFETQKRYIEETRKFILAYIDNEANLNSIDACMELNTSTWGMLYAACDKFKEEGRNLILIVGDGVRNINQDTLKFLSLPQWNLIIDYDYNSESEGFFHKAYGESAIPPHKIKAADRITPEDISRYTQSHYHFFANNFLGTGFPLRSNFNEWDRAYGKSTESFLKSYAEVFSNQKNIVLILHNKRRDIDFLCQKITRYFDGDTQFVIANDLDNALKNILEDFNALKIDISIVDILTGIRSHSSNFGISKKASDKYFIPYMEKSETVTSGELSAADFSNYEEYFELLHTDLPNKDDQEIEDFLTGKERISWMGIKMHYDVEQKDFNKRYIKPIEKAFNNTRGKIMLLHEPGYGGTTIARRIAWHFHEEYPTLFLKKYREEKVRNLIINLHEKTRKTIFVVMEVPQTITQDEVNLLYKSIQSARPVVFLIVKRGGVSQGEMCVTDWGDEINILTKPYIPFLKEKYRENSLPYNKKIEELTNLSHSTNPDEKTPFYVGLVTFEDGFAGIKSYISSFVSDINQNSIWKKVIVYLSLCDKYIGMGLPVSVFRPILKVQPGEIIDLGKYFGLDSFIVSKLLYNLPGDNKNKVWKIRHSFFSKELLKQLLGGDSQDPNTWKNQLAKFCIDFIEDTGHESGTSEFLQDVLQKLFIGNKIDRSGENFTALINDIPTPEGKEEIFLKLTEVYPENPHYCSHLARLYAYDQKLKNNEKAIEWAEKAINISESEGRKDHLLYHIKGMCLRAGVYEMIDSQIKSFRHTRSFDKEIYDEIIYTLVDLTGLQFEISRKIALEQNKLDEYGYIAHIQLLVRAIDFGLILSNKPKSEFISRNQEPFNEWIDLAESLLDDVSRMNIDDDDSGKISECENSILEFYDQYGTIIQNLNNSLVKSKSPNNVRRQIVRAHYRKNPSYFENAKTLQNVMSLMEQNIESEPNNERNFYLWFQAARHSYISINETITKLAQWTANSSTLDATYYFYILKTFKALEGYSDAIYDARKLIKETRQIGRSNIRIYDWYGKGNGLKKLVSNREITDANKDNKLELVEGVITQYQHAGSGIITIADGIDVFFNPTQAKLTSDHLNARVMFYLGFSYDGPRADSSSIILKK